MTALPSAIKQINVREAAQNYALECLRMITENTAKDRGGKYIEISFDDIVSPKPQRSADEIVESIKTKFRG